jgi:hypothetical protein
MKSNEEEGRVAFSFLRMTPALASEALGGWGVDLFRCCRMQEKRLFWMVFRRFCSEKRPFAKTGSGPPQRNLEDN